MARGGQSIVGTSVLATVFRSRRVSLLVLAAFLLVWASVFFVSRSFLVEAETSYAEFTFAGEVNAWQFRDATVCHPRETPDPFATSPDGAPCNLQIFEAPETIAAGHRTGGGTVGAQLNEVTVNWSCGARVAVQADPSGDLVITVLGLGEVEAQARPCRDGANDARAIATGKPDFTEGTTILVPAPAWRSNGALPFHAEASVGEDIGPGAVHFLQSGRWEARQTSPVFQLLRIHTVTEVVKSGDLSVGAEVTVYDREHPAIMWGHVTPTPDDLINSLPGFDVVMLSAPGRTELRLAHFGFAEATSIRPDWVDTAITSPLFLAIFAILNLLAVICQIFSDGPRLVGPKPAEEPNGPGGEPQSSED